MEGSTQSETNGSSPTAKDASVPDSASSEANDHSTPCPESEASGSSPPAKDTTPGSETSGSSPPATPGSEASGSSPPAKDTTPACEISGSSPPATPGSEASGPPAMNESRHQVITKTAQLEAEGAHGHDELGQLTPGGYDYKLVDENARERWECPICHLIPRKPAKVGCSCGQIFCHACISTQTECPVCRDTFERCMVLKHLERNIRHQKVYCVNQDKGCEWTGELGDVPQHLQDPTNLPGTERCLYQVTTCKQCDKELLYMDLSHHMDSICEHRIVTCEYQFAGCDFEGPEMNMPQHLQESIVTHLALVSKLATNQMLVSKVTTKKFQRWYWFTLAALVITLSIAMFMANIQINNLEDANSKLLDSLNDELENQDIRIDNLVSQLDYLASQINGMKSESFYTTIVKSIIKNTIGKLLPSGYIDWVT